MKYSYIFIMCSVLLASCKANLHFVKTEDHTYYRAEMPSNANDSVIQKIILPYKLKMQEEVNEVLGVSEQVMEIAQPSSSLGNWIGDLIFEQVNEYDAKGVDFAVVNKGGLRIPSLPKGDITRGKIFELMPFENYLVVLELDSSEVQSFLNYIAEKGGWPVSKSLRCTIKDKLATKIFIDDKPLNNKQLYRVAMSDYLANGGDGCSMLIAKQQFSTQKLVRDAIIQYVTKQTRKALTLKPSNEMRFTLQP